MNDYGNESAFPVFEHPSKGDGITRLEWFAGMALQGALASTSNAPAITIDKPTASRIAVICFELAEAMCAEAEKRSTK